MRNIDWIGYANNVSFSFLLFFIIESPKVLPMLINSTLNMAVHFLKIIFASIILLKTADLFVHSNCVMYTVYILTITVSFTG